MFWNRKETIKDVLLIELKEKEILHATDTHFLIPPVFSNKDVKIIFESGSLDKAVKSANSGSDIPIYYTIALDVAGLVLSKKIVVGHVKSGSLRLGSFGINGTIVTDFLTMPSLAHLAKHHIALDVVYCANNTTSVEGMIGARVAKINHFVIK